MKWSRFGALAIVVAAILPLGPMLLKGEVPSFRDHEDYFLPLRAYTADALRAGELPLWNPLNASGEPWLANPQTGVFYPPAWLVAALPFAAGYVSFLVVHLVVFGLGARRLYLLAGSDAAATLVSAALVVSGPVLSLLDVANNLATFAWTPWILALALDRKRSPGVLDSVLLALSFLGGEPLLAAVTWAAWASILMVRFGRSGASVVGWRLFMAVALAAAQLMPFAAMLEGSDRAAGLDAEVAFRNSMALGDWLAAIVSPAGVQPGIGSSQLFLPSIYVSPLIVLVALLSASGREQRGARVGWAVVLASSAVLASGGQFPPVAWLYESLQLTASRYPVKFALFGFLALGALCVIGFDRLRAATGQVQLACGSAAVALFILAHAIHRSDHAPVAATGLVVGLFWLGGFIALLRFGPRIGGEARMLLVCALLPLVVFESIAASRFLLGSQPWPAAQPYAGLLEDEYRVMRLEQLDAARSGARHVRDRVAWMGGYLNLLSHQSDASTAAPVVDQRYQDLHDLALTHAREDLLNVLSVRYLFTERDLTPFGYRSIASHGGVAVFERPGVPAMLVADFAPLPVEDEESALRRLVAPHSSGGPARTLASGLRTAYPSDAPPGASGRVLQLELTHDSVRAEVDVSAPALLVLHQRSAEGWSVTVDGDARHTVTANALFRGVEVDRGRHVVEWTYSPKSVRAGIFVSLAAMIALVLEWRRVRAMRKKMSRSFHSELA